MGEKVVVKWSYKASSNLSKIYFYIAEDSPVYAKRFTESLIRKTEKQLSTVPNSGRKVPEFENTPLAFLREVIFKGYRIIYSFEKEKIVTILSVINGRMDLENHINSGWVIE